MCEATSIPPPMSSIPEVVSLSESSSQGGCSSGSDNKVPLASLSVEVEGDAVIDGLPTRRKKKVRFSRRTKTNIYYKDDKSHSWLSDNHIMKRHHKASAIAWKENKRFTSLIKKDSFTNPGRKSLEAFALLSGDDCMRGLESYACTGFQMARLRYRKNHIESILDLETDLRQQGNISYAESTEKMAQLSQKLSQNATKFALCMAKADESAANAGETFETTPIHPDVPEEVITMDDSTCAWNVDPEDTTLSLSSIAAKVAIGVLDVACSLTSTI